MLWRGMPEMEIHLMIKVKIKIMDSINRILFASILVRLFLMSYLNQIKVFRF